MEGEESRVMELDVGQLAVFGHLERVERMRCYWELKHVQLKTLEQVTPTDMLDTHVHTI